MKALSGYHAAKDRLQLFFVALPHCGSLFTRFRGGLGVETLGLRRNSYVLGYGTDLFGEDYGVGSGNTQWSGKVLLK